MAIIPANMDDCGPKRKCIWGDNEGLAYTPGAECPPCETFSEALCDCVPNPDRAYFCEIAWVSQDYGISVVENSNGDCVTEKTDYNGNRADKVYNQGACGADPMGLAWVFQDSFAGSCTYTQCGDSAGLVLRHGNAVIEGQQPSSYPHEIIYLACRNDFSEGYEHFFSDTGVVLGYGATQTEAFNNAYNKLIPPYTE